MKKFFALFPCFLLAAAVLCAASVKGSSGRHDIGEVLQLTPGQKYTAEYRISSPYSLKLSEASISHPGKKLCSRTFSVKVSGSLLTVEMNPQPKAKVDKEEVVVYEVKDNLAKGGEIFHISFSSDGYNWCSFGAEVARFE